MKGARVSTDTAMDVMMNQTSGSELLQTALFAFNCSVLTLTLLLGSLGNLWVCWLVFRTRSLQTSNNALLVSLAASDLLKCSLDTPLLLCSLLGVLRSSAAVCSLQQFTYALCSCVQLLTLVGISVERFQAIAFPFQTEGRKVRVRLWICSIWGCGLLLALLSLALAEQVTSYMLCSHDPDLPQRWDLDLPQRWDPFGACVLVPVWGLSLAIIVIHYVRIFRVVRRHRRKVFNQGGTLLLVAEAGAARGGGGGGVQRGGPEIVGAVCLLTPGAKERGKKQMEGKVAQRFGYIIIAFTLLWLPMVVILLLNVVSWHEAHRLLLELETSAVVLTCVQAAVDPLIYTLVTRQFRSELSKILSSIPGCPLRPRA